MTSIIRQRISDMEGNERILCLGIGDTPRLFSERQKHQDNADALAAVLGELDRLAIIEEAFGLSMQHADRIMQLARAIGVAADAIFCPQNDIRHDRKLPAVEAV